MFKDREEPKLDASYIEVQKYYTEKEYFERFEERLRRELVKQFDEDVAEKTLKYVREKKIKVVNPESFFNKEVRFVDPSQVLATSDYSIERYFREVVLAVKKNRAEGGRDCILVGFLVTVARFIDNFSKTKTPAPDLHQLMNNFVLSLTELREIRTSNLDIFVLDKMLFDEYINGEGLSYESYYLAYKMLLNAYDNLQKSLHALALRPPSIKHVHAVFSDGQIKRISLLHKLLGLDRSFIKEALKHLNTFDVTNEELSTVLDYLIARSNKGVTKEEVLNKLNTSVELVRLQTYSYGNSLIEKYNGELDKVLEKKFRITHLYINLDSFKDLIIPALSEVRIDCSNMHGNSTEYEGLLDCAHAINMIRIKLLFPKVHNATSRIVLHNLTYLGAGFIARVLQKQKLLKATYGKSITVPIYYNYMIKRKVAPVMENKYIRIISDVHADINKERNYLFDFSNDFVVCCGDVSGNARTSTQWIKNNIEKGVFVHGNHLAYNNIDSSLNYSGEGCETHETNTLNGQIKYLEENFSKNSEVQYLYNSCYEYEGIVFVGTCLYTDFNLYGEDKKDKYMNFASTSMNDFVYPHLIENGITRRVTPSDHARLNKQAREFLWDTTLTYASKPLVIVTHHAPLPFSIGNDYIGSPLNPAFVSDMRDLINNRSNIRIIAHGHVHNRFDYVYKNTRIICEPFGYYNENNMTLPKYAGKRVLIETIKDEEKWKKALRNKVTVNKNAVRYTDKDLCDFI